jgi:hypothetical protein
MRRYVLGPTALAALALVIVTPAPAAQEHGGSQPIPDAAFYRTDLTGVAPPAGWSHSPGGPGRGVDRVDQRRPAEVIVLGYTREPYL